jgi:hypothetical protein
MQFEMSFLNAFKNEFFKRILNTFKMENFSPRVTILDHLTKKSSKNTQKPESALTKVYFKALKKGILFML